MLEIGQSLAHFKILEKLGEGGMGAVYLAEDQNLHRNVAIKVLLPDAFDNSEKRERFQREAKTAAQISHGNVMAIFDIGRTKDEKSGQDIDYIVMEQVKGKQLSEYLVSNSPDISEVIVLAEKISSGLAAAHALHIVHRDIKSDNIIINEFKEPKILDFGLAKPVDPMFESNDVDSTDTVDKELTKAGKIIGTVSYMSPEQAKGDKIDTRSDIFSFGVLLYRMATGDFPFTGPTQVSTLAKILETNPAPARDKNANIPPELDRIIDKCLQKDPNDRYQDTRDLTVDLRKLRRLYDSGMSETISTEIDKPVQVKTVEVKIPRKPALIISIVAVIAFFVAWQMFDTSPSLTSEVQAKEQSLAILGFENKTGDSDLDWLETGLPEIMLTDLSQTQSIQIISQSRILDCLPEDKRINHTFDECVAAAGTMGAVHVLSGAFYKLEDKIRIDARIEDVKTGQILQTHKVVGREPFVLVDSLTQKIAASLNFQNEMSDNRSVSSFAASPEAYRKYLEGMKLFTIGLDDTAITVFRSAIEIDSSFALPYMRIGMTHIFNGRQNEGLKYFILAKERESSLPPREKSLLDVYSELWIEQNYNDGFVKMESFVKNFPEDKEGQTIYGLLAFAFRRDTTESFKYFEKALEIDPSFMLALSQYSQIYRNLGIYDRALEIAERAKKSHPDSPDAYNAVALIYADRNEVDRAIFEYQAILKKFPKSESAINSLSSLYLKKKDFKKAYEYLAMTKDFFGDDPFKMRGYYNRIGNLLVWEGKFRQSLKSRFNVVEEALKCGDSTLILNAYNTIAEYYNRFGYEDSALVYYQIGEDWSNSFQNFQYYFGMTEIDPSLDGILRPKFDSFLTKFKSKIPAELWYLSDGFEKMYLGVVSSDTLKIIEGLKEVNKNDNNNQTNFAIGMYYTKLGEFALGKEWIEKSEMTDENSTGAYAYLTANYYLGLAEEGLGNIEQAKKHFGIVLKYWGNADIDVKVIRDTREHLSKLSS